MRICLNCNLNKTYIDKHGWAKWYKQNGGWQCQKCHNKLVTNPKWASKWNPINNPKLLRWTPTGKRFLVKEPPRKHICQWCGKQGLTHIHHIQYHEDDPLKDTIELCIACHPKTRIGMKYHKKK